MILYPAIDIMGGNCVRLEQGDFDRATEYSGNPAEQALKWAECGSSFIHIVDLDGARSGEGLNDDAIRVIARTVDLPLQVGGGIRSMANIERHLSIGISRVILGTVAVRNPELVREAVREYGKMIAIGVDSKDGMVAVEGWGEVSSMETVELCERMRDSGVSVIIHTDISRDGMMTGPNLEAAKAIIGIDGLDVIISGGISSISDLHEARDIGASGAIIGKALYTGAINLRDAVAVFERGR